MSETRILLDKIIAFSTLKRLFVSVISLLVVVTVIMSRPTGDFQTVSKSLGRPLPELRIGLLPGEPFASIAKMGATRFKYMTLQFWDILNIFFAIATFILVIGNFARIFLRSRTLANVLIMLVMLYAIAEITENTFLIMMISSYPKNELADLALPQQIATTIKLASSIVLVPGSLFLATALCLKVLHKCYHRSNPDPDPDRERIICKRSSEAQ